MSGHEYFEELCAAVALGEASESEAKELHAHFSLCQPCRATYEDFSNILQQHLPLLDHSPSRRLGSMLPGLKDNGYRERFIERARAMGLSFSPEAERGPVWGRAFAVVGPSLRPAAIVLTLMLAAGAFIYSVIQSRQRALSEETMLARSTAAQPQLESPQFGQLAQLETERDALRAEVATLQDAHERLVSELAALKRDAARGKIEASALRTALDDSRIANTALDGRMREREQRLAELAKEIETLRASQANDAATIVAQKRRLDELMQQVNAQREVQERELQFLVADRDIRELMGARNLHIVDVFDVDGRGKNKRAFGRVFYTEGRSLVFYAFDLGDPKVVPAKHSFQAWGQLEGAAASAISLGIFYVDNAAQRRWVLKFDDPEVLSHIDAVFVTVEPPGGGKRPTGQKLLYAYLSSQANHP